MSYVTWTPDMDAALRDLRKVGAGYCRCGERIGVHATVVKRRVAELALPTWDQGRMRAA